MSRVFLGLVVIVTLVLAGTEVRAQVPPPPPPPPPPPTAPARDAPMRTGTAVIRGRVLAAGTNAPLARAEVRVTSPDSPNGKSTETDANGRYEVTALPGGKYNVFA